LFFPAIFFTSNVYTNQRNKSAIIQSNSFDSTHVVLPEALKDWDHALHKSYILFSFAYLQPNKKEWHTVKDKITNFINSAKSKSRTEESNEKDGLNKKVNNINIEDVYELE